MGRLLLLDLGRDVRRPRGREVGVEHGGRDADPLLSPGLTVGVESGAIEQPREDVRDLLAEDPGPVVGDRNPQPVVPLLGDLDGYLGENARLFGRVDRIVHSLFHGGEERPLGVVESQDLAISLEELGDGDLALLRG